LDSESKYWDLKVLVIEKGRKPEKYPWSKDVKKQQQTYSSFVAADMIRVPTQATLASAIFTLASLLQTTTS